MMTGQKTVMNFLMVIWVLMNPPTVVHTLIIKFLEKKFHTEIERLALAWIALRDTGIRTGAKSRLPDLSVFTTEQASLLINESAVFQTPPSISCRSCKS